MDVVPAPPPADRTPFRVVRDELPPRARRATAAWVASALTGLAALALAAAHAPARRHALAAALAARDPDRPAAQVRRVATAGVDAALGWVLVLVVVQLALLGPARRRRGPALALVVVALLQLAALLVVPGLLSAPGWGAGSLVRWALLAQGACGIVGALGRWPRRRSPPRRRRAAPVPPAR